MMDEKVIYEKRGEVAWVTDLPHRLGSNSGC